MPEPFSGAWAEALGVELEASDGYRESARNWEGTLVLEQGSGDGAGAPPRAVWLDLWHGRCREARVAEEADLETADFRIAAGESGWLRVLAGEVDPLFALMSGQLRLERGSIGRLLPFAAAARELVAAARRATDGAPEATG